MPIETNVRTRRPAAAVMALQSAKGTAVNDLRIASGGVRVWTQKITIPAGKTKNDPRWMNELFAENRNARVTIRDENDGELWAVATPEFLKTILQSNWGPMVGTPAVSTLSSVVNKYVTLAWIESTRAGSTQKLVRIIDVFPYRMTIRLSREGGKLLVHAFYSGISSDRHTLDSLGPVQFTAAPMTPADVRVYNVRNASFLRNPTGTPVSLDFVDLEITLDQQVNSEWTFAGWDVWKRGKTSVFVKFTMRVTDETWALLENSIAGTQERFRITATTDGSPSSTLTVDLFSLDWKFEDIGHDDTMGCLVEATGRAFMVAQPAETGFVKFTIS